MWRRKEQEKEKRHLCHQGKIEQIAHLWLATLQSGQRVSEGSSYLLPSFRVCGETCQSL